MQIQKQSPGLTELLAKLLPGLGGAIGTAAGGPVGGAFGAATGAGLGSFVNQPQPEAQMIGGNNQISSQQAPGSQALESSLTELLSRLSGMQTNKETQQQESEPEQAQATEEQQKGTFKEFFDQLSDDGKATMITLLKTIALPYAGGK